MSPAARTVLKLSGITHRRGPAPALDAVDLTLAGGEIVALLGDSGSGKSTLIHILIGDEAADEGTIRVARRDDGAALVPLRTGSRRAALRAGIGAMRREPALAATLTGLQNIIIAARTLWRPTLNRRAARAQLHELRRRLALTVELDVPVATLAGGGRLQIELLRAVHRGSRILVLDEPSAAQTAQETATLVAALKKLAADGASAVFSTRRPDEALAGADRVVVLRAGRKVADLATRDTDAATLAALLAGRAVATHPSTPHAPGNEVLELSLIDASAAAENLALHQVSLVVRAGEIIGVAGTPHNGQDTLAAVVAGATRPSAGQIRLFGRTPRRFDPALAVRAGIGKVPADCRRDGLVGDMSVAENLLLERVDVAPFVRHGLLDRRAMYEHAGRLIADCGLAGVNPDMPASALSAAQAQKLVLGRVFEHHPHLILAHDPSHGLDLAARADVHRRLVAEREDGAAILLISADLDELLALSDYIGVLHRGRLTVPQPAGAFDRHNLGLMMGGQGSLAQDWSGWGGGT